MIANENKILRDDYIDFLRALGLLLLIGVHVNAPEWYKPLRSFDVPLMVFISSLCYKPLRGGVFSVWNKAIQTHIYSSTDFLDAIFYGNRFVSFYYRNTYV